MNNSLSHTTFGLIGHPLTHSFSKRYFTRLFEGDPEGRSYDNFDLPELTPAALYEMLLLNPLLRGFNVTAPYKEAIMEYLDNINPIAAEIGAVNTVVVRRSPDGRILGLDGYNTDAEGFRRSVERRMPAGARNAIILGTGGASKAVEYAFDFLGMKVVRVSRKPQGQGVIAYTDITPELVTESSVVVNATPLGTFPNIDDCPDFPYEYLTPDHLAYDLVYNPAETLFMRRAGLAGARTCNGMEMLVNQAMASLEIWTSK